MSYAVGLPRDGSVVVGIASFQGSYGYGFLWDDQHGMRKLRDVLTSQGVDLTGWGKLTIKGISSDGHTIAGTAQSPSGQFEAWIATVPEPGTLWLLATGLPLLVGVGRGRARGRGPQGAADPAQRENFT